MKLHGFLALAALLCLPAYSQQTTTPPTTVNAPTTAAPSTSTESVPLPNGVPRAPHTPLHGPYHLQPQNSTQKPATQNPSGNPPAATSAPVPANGTVVFSRQDAPVDASQESVPQTQKTAAFQKNVTIPVTDAERAALTYTSYNCEVHLVPSEHSISVRAHMTVRNDGKLPLTQLALQISSALTWYSVHTGSSTASFVTHKIDSDIDHTGKLDEAVVTLPQPLAVGATLPLDVIYSGVVQQSAERLLRIGAPEGIALSSDWDRIEPGFTGLRGFGNVIWYPVSTVPVLLGEGATVFDTIGQWKLRESSATVRMQVLVEYRDQAPNIAILNGHIIQPDAQSSTTAQPPAPVPAQTSNIDVLHVASFSLPPESLGFQPFGLFVLTRTPVAAKSVTVYARTGDESDASNYQQAADLVRPMVEQWLGTHQKRPVVLIDLPEAGDLPYEDRNVLWLPLTQDQPKDLTPLLAHMSSHAYFISPRVWLDEGVAQFMTTLWTEHVAGRDTAIEQLDSRRSALALAEPTHPGDGVGQSLIAAYSDIYYRDKAAFVFWMLRDMIGGSALRSVLRNYDAAQDREPSYFQHLTEKASSKDYEWFFDDWVYRDRGLPDLKIVSVYSRPLLRNGTNSYLVSVEVENDGNCSAEVPVELQSGTVNQSGRLRVPSNDKSAVRILMQNLPDVVIVNDGTVPEVESSIHKQAVKELQRNN